MVFNDDSWFSVQGLLPWCSVDHVVLGIKLSAPACKTHAQPFKPSPWPWNLLVLIKGWLILCNSTVVIDSMFPPEI